ELGGDRDDLGAARHADNSAGFVVLEDQQGGHVVVHAFAGLWGVRALRMGGRIIEARHAVAEEQAGAGDGDVGAEPFAVGQRERAAVALGVGGDDVHRVLAGGRRGEARWWGGVAAANAAGALGGGFFG